MPAAALTSDADSKWQTIPVPAGVGASSGVGTVQTGANFGGNFGPNGSVIGIGEGRSEIQVDMYALQLVTQIGFVGFTLFCLGWLVFLARAFRVARYTSGSTFSRDTAAGVFGALVTMMVASSHVDAWGYVSLAATYYLLGAIVTSTPDPVAPSGPAGASVFAATAGSEP